MDAAHEVIRKKCSITRVGLIYEREIPAVEPLGRNVSFLGSTRECYVTDGINFGAVKFMFDSNRRSENGNVRFCLLVDRNFSCEKNFMKFELG